MINKHEATLDVKIGTGINLVPKSWTIDLLTDSDDHWGTVSTEHLVNKDGKKVLTLALPSLTFVSITFEL